MVENVYFSGWGLTATGQCSKNLLYHAKVVVVEVEGRSSKWYLRKKQDRFMVHVREFAEKSKSFVGIHHLDSDYYFSLL